ncbi:hypothetical protein [Arthrobacter sp. H35-D1]|uniref:hypothetical protein n=1 Tax=Arthrobacter sp. H35-D1 TaxID=3046202 RepID=UPI0024B93198|nr:hypothetical protein [Arthrobacter sp. H35-D1]MDJ0314104.1 hypothetical protein [Arthrobacter sp. H35-D1]
MTDSTGHQPTPAQHPADPDHQPPSPAQHLPERKSGTPKPHRWAALAAAAGAGIGSGLLGTSLHGHAWYFNGGDTVVPYGAVLALLLLASVCLFVGLWSRNSWVAVVCGAAAYLTAGALSLQLGSVGMITNNLQGTVWLYGIAVATPLTSWLAWALLRKKR